MKEKYLSLYHCYNALFNKEENEYNIYHNKTNLLIGKVNDIGYTPITNYVHLSVYEMKILVSFVETIINDFNIYENK